ncbi:MAG: GHKL domain-containing protein [Deltaproteobacteria bacterium]|nr:GHKL domain-containing protein [Deltaproteobacteria bacterium]
MLSNPYYRSLTRNMILLVIIVSFTPLILVSGIILFQFNFSYKEKVEAHLAELVLKHKQNIDSFLNGKLGEIRYLARTHTFEELSDEDFLQGQLAALQGELGPYFVDLGVINERGIQVSYAGPFKLGKAFYADAVWFQKTMKRHYFISDVFLGLRGLPHFIVAVRENWNGENWILRATVDFVAFNRLVENLRIGETGFAYILNREGKFQTKPFFDIPQKERPYREFLKIDEQDSEKVHIVEKTDAKGRKNIYVAAFLKNGDWLLVYQQDEADALRDLPRTRNIAIIIIILGGVGIITMAFLLSWRMVSRIARVDREKELMDEQMIEAGRLASLGELGAGIAHEINNPVAIMVEEAGWIEDLLEEEEFKEGKNLAEIRRALKQIRTQGHRCREITHKLLSFARKTDSRVQEVYLNDLVNEVLSLSSQRAKYSKVTIETHLQENLPALDMSPAEFQQVMLNLINNALDAMEKDGGSIDITTRYVNNEFKIEVSDTGPGIHSANLPRIFDPFFTTKPVGKGTGLGLSICYGIIKKMGGEIEVQSEVDVGTRFFVHIPYEKK